MREREGLFNLNLSIMDICMYHKMHGPIYVETLPQRKYHVDTELGGGGGKRGGEN